MENKTDITIDWKELDEYWAKRYEIEYGNLFSCCSRKHIDNTK
jgi:hypothetical protein